MKHPLRRRLMYLGFLGLRSLAQALPLPVAQALGRTMGSLAYGVLGTQRRLALGHLAYAFGDSLSASQRRAVARRAFRHLGANVMEWLALPKLSSQAMQQLITCEGLEHLRQALSQGNGAIVVTPHFGNWELIPLYLKSLGFEGGVLARRLRYPEYESFLISLRGSRGVPTLARGSLKEVAKLLRANQLVGMLPDQDMDSLEGVFVNFFGHPAYTPVGPAALSVMTGAPIVPCFLIRQRARFRLVIQPSVRLPQAADRAQAVSLLTQSWSEVMESFIRQYPDHWVWMHRRWKTQPSLVTSDKGQVTSIVAERTASGAAETPTMKQPCLAVTLLMSCIMTLAGLAGCGKSSQQSHAPSETTSETVTQRMQGIDGTSFDASGTRPANLQGVAGSLEGNLVTIQKPDVVSHGPDRTVYVRASLGQYDLTTRRVRLEHDATVQTSDGLWVTSPTMYWLPDQQAFTTDQSVRLETDHMLLRGREAVGHTEMKQVTILRDIELVLNPSEHDQPSAKPTQVIITCDGPLMFDYERHIATFEQNVHVKDPNGELYSDRLIAYLDPVTRTIRYAEAIGRVRIHQQHNTALSERAIYEPAVGKITLVGKPSLLVYPSQGTEAPQLSFGGLTTTPQTDSRQPREAAAQP